MTGSGLAATHSPSRSHPIDSFEVVGVKPGFNHDEENGTSAFETITEESFPGKWKVIYFWPKDFTFVCPAEIVGFNKLARQFEERDAVLLGGSTDNPRSAQIAGEAGQGLRRDRDVRGIVRVIAAQAHCGAGAHRCAGRGRQLETHEVH